MLTIIQKNLVTKKKKKKKKKKTFNIEQFNMMNNDTVLIKKTNDNLILKSKGTSKTYTLNLILLTHQEISLFIILLYL